MTRRRVWGTNPRPILTRASCAVLGVMLVLFLVWVAGGCAIASGEGSNARVGTLFAPDLAASASIGASAPGERPK